MSDEPDVPTRRVYGPAEWRELTGAPLPSMPGGSVMCAAVKESGQLCGNRAMAGTTLCRNHGGTTVLVQEQARRRIDMVRSELFDKLCTAAKEAADTYINIMKNGKRDADKIKAADRVLELLGFRDTVANLPAGDHEESDIDKQLKTLLVQVTEERLSRVIDATASESNADDHAA